MPLTLGFSLPSPPHITITLLLLSAMLAANVNETPRPRPPAKIRRSSALAHSASTPPPSYAAAFTLSPGIKPRVNTLLGSPMSATFQRVGWDGDRQMSPTREEDLEWMHEKSREELSDLLLKADDLIKNRENELGVASAVCKSLYDNNVMLKNKHQQLLARLPSSSPSPEPVSRSFSSSQYSISLNRPISEYDSSPVASTTYKHARKISVSTTEISHLADQNAELLEKLERMEADSLNADQTGRRALKRLEKEISTLREELEKTQAKSEELEQKTKAGWHAKNEETMRKKEERENKFRAMRSLGQAEDEDEDEEEQEIRDFAPEGSIFGGPSTGYPFLPPGTTPRRLSGTPLKRPPSTSAPFTPHPESTLIAQLLEKIQELEETNGRIIEQQNETTHQLTAMQRETEHISKVYECLTDANLIEVAGDRTPDVEGVRTHDETVRFTSFARNLAAEYTSSPNGDGIHQSLNLSTSKMRKSVVGLFDGHDDENQDHNRGATTPDQLKAFNLPVPFASPEERHSKSLSIESTGLVSPALSTLGLSPSRNKSQNLFSSSRRTLETELANELDDGWGFSAHKHHLRTNSLYDLSPISAPASPSPSSGHGSFSQSRNIGSPRDALPTPLSMTSGTTALRLSVEPPTPDKVSKANKSQAEGSAQSLRYHRMSETLRSRTNRWVDGRFKDTLTGSNKFEFPADHRKGKREEPDHEEQDASRPSTPLPLRLASAFDAAVENITGQPVSRSEDGQEVARASESQVKKQPKGFGAVMLELWLWLQFAIIILVFLWAMAKRGPKSILGDTDGHRRTRTISMAR
ncbi:hypothetical protein H0H87_000750 [Tephrocybe sp. NHM501043]|nr:hypothetical protein H0H87_000750 [Tephrocybe sp. NHM501043]